MNKGLNALLWTLQALLAALFLFAGGIKLAMPMDKLAQQAHLNGPFLKFIGVMEVLGGLGLILPGIFRTRRELTPLAAAGLVIIMIGAVSVTIMQGSPGAWYPGIIGVLCAIVAYARRRRAVPTTA